MTVNSDEMILIWSYKTDSSDAHHMNSILTRCCLVTVNSWTKKPFLDVTKARDPDRKRYMTTDYQLLMLILGPPLCSRPAPAHVKLQSMRFQRFPCVWMTEDVYNLSGTEAERDSSWAQRRREDAGIMGTHHQINFRRASLPAIRLHNGCVHTHTRQWCTKVCVCVCTDRSCLRAYSNIFIRLTRSFFRFSWPFLSPCRNAIWACNKKVYSLFI